AGRLGSSFKLWVEPPVPVVKVGGSIVLTLRSTCEDPAGRGDFRVAPERGRRRGPGVLELLNVSFADSAVESFYCCYGETPTLFTNLVVYQDPGPVTLEPVPWLRVGTAHQLVCRVENAAPVRSLRVTLLRDSEPLNMTTFESPEQQVADSLRVSYDLWVGRQDHGRNLSCQALLDLAPHGPQPRDTSRPQLLQVYEFPAAPQLEPDLHVAAGEEVTTSCSVSGAFPAPRFTVTLGGRPLPLTVSQDGLRATATLCHPEPGNLTLLCSVTVGPQERHSEATVHVHSERGGDRGAAGWCPPDTASPSRGRRPPQASPHPG
ncbi:ICAM1 protein, partial [Rhinopomastus cyanomelas]|nr:ICAM1 protein [Rhinopomastus cyanomelas]